MDKRENTVFKSRKMKQQEKILIKRNVSFMSNHLKIISGRQ